MLLADIWRFAIGMSATTFISFFLGQADRIILSKILTLELFGYYTLATTLNNGLRGVGAQINTALFPRFSTLVAKNDENSLRSLYHQVSQLNTVIMLPASVIGALFSYELLRLWTQNVSTAEVTAPIVAVLFIGTALNSLMGAPYRLMLSYGWTSLGFFQNLISVIVVVPLMISLSILYGGLGAAITWVILNMGYVVITPRLVHNRLLKGELRKWYVKDIGIPALAVVMAAMVGQLFFISEMPDWLLAIMLCLLMAIVYGVAILFAPEIRKLLASYIKRFVNNYVH
jgi:O-antigen/teichoic acid export membrane protein